MSSFVSFFGSIGGAGVDEKISSNADEGGFGVAEVVEVFLMGANASDLGNDEARRGVELVGEIEVEEIEEIGDFLVGMAIEGGNKLEESGGEESVNLRPSNK